MKGFALLLIFFAFNGFCACDSYTFTNDPNNITVHRIRYLDDQRNPDLMQLSPGDSMQSRGVPSHIKAEVYANLDPQNNVQCDVFLGTPNHPFRVVVQGPQQQPQGVTAHCPNVDLNLKTCEVTLTDASD